MTKNQSSLINPEIKKTQIQEIEVTRTNCGIIIATSFSMIVFLLSFIKVITFPLYSAIIFLFISIILLFELIYYLARARIKLEEEGFTIEDYVTFNKVDFTLHSFGHILFYIGLLFLISHFQLLIIGIPFMVFINVRSILPIKMSIESYNKLKVKEDQGDNLKLEKFYLLIDILRIILTISVSIILIYYWINFYT